MRQDPSAILPPFAPRPYRASLAPRQMVPRYDRMASRGLIRCKQAQILHAAGQRNVRRTESSSVLVGWVEPATKPTDVREGRRWCLMLQNGPYVTSGRRADQRIPPLSRRCGSLMSAGCAICGLTLRSCGAGPLWRGQWSRVAGPHWSLTFDRDGRYGGARFLPSPQCSHRHSCGAQYRVVRQCPGYEVAAGAQQAYRRWRWRSVGYDRQRSRKELIPPRREGELD